MKKKILHLGISSPEFFLEDSVVSAPILTLTNIPLQEEFKSHLNQAGYLIITSKALVNFFLKPYRDLLRPSLKILAIGTKTKQAIEEENFNIFATAKIATQEGIIDLLKTVNFQDQLVLYPHSDLARPLIKEFFLKNNIQNLSFSCYQTQKNPLFEKKDLQSFDGVYFTSPSCVKFFFETYCQGYEHLMFYCIGDVTTNYLKTLFGESELVKRIVNMQNKD